MWMVHQHRLAAVSGFAVFAALTTAVLLSDLPHDPVAPGKPVIHDLGLELLGDCMLGFETAGVTLLAALIGTVVLRSEEHTSELQSLMRISYAVFCLKKK